MMFLAMVIFFILLCWVFSPDTKQVRKPYSPSYSHRLHLRIKAARTQADIEACYTALAMLKENHTGIVMAMVDYDGLETVLALKALELQQEQGYISTNYQLN